MKKDLDIRSANRRRIIPLIILIVIALAAFILLALGEKIAGLVLLFFVEPFVGVWTAISFSNYIKTRDKLFSSTWLNKLNEHFSDLTYEAGQLY